MFKYRFEDGSVRDLEGKDEAYIAAFIKRHPTAVLIEEDVETEVKGKAKGPAATEVAAGPQVETPEELTDDQILFPGSELKSEDSSSESPEVDTPTEGDGFVDDMNEEVVIEGITNADIIADEVGSTVYSSDKNTYEDALDIAITNRNGLNFNALTDGNIDNLNAFALANPDKLIIAQEDGIEGAGGYRDSLDNVKDLYFSFNKLNKRSQTSKGISYAEAGEMARIEKMYLSAREVHEKRFKTLEDNVEFISREDLSDRRSKKAKNAVKEAQIALTGSEKEAGAEAVRQSFRHLPENQQKLARAQNAAAEMPEGSAKEVATAEARKIADDLGLGDKLFDPSTGEYVDIAKASSKAKAMSKEAAKKAYTTDKETLALETFDAESSLIGAILDLSSVMTPAIKDEGGFIKNEDDGYFENQAAIKRYKADKITYREHQKTIDYVTKYKKLPPNLKDLTSLFDYDKGGFLKSVTGTEGFESTFGKLASRYNNALDKYLVTSTALHTNTNPISDEDDHILNELADSAKEIFGVKGNTAKEDKDIFINMLKGTGQYDETQLNEATNENKYNNYQHIARGFPHLVQFVGELWVTKKLSGGSIAKLGKWGLTAANKYYKANSFAAKAANVVIPAVVESGEFALNTALWNQLGDRDDSIGESALSGASLSIGGTIGRGFFKYLGNAVSKTIIPSKLADFSYIRGLGEKDLVQAAFKNFQSASGGATAYTVGGILLDPIEFEYTEIGNTLVQEYWKMFFLGKLTRGIESPLGSLRRGMEMIQTDILSMSNQNISSKKGKDLLGLEKDFFRKATEESNNKALRAAQKKKREITKELKDGKLTPEEAVARRKQITEGLKAVNLQTGINQAKQNIEASQGDGVMPTTGRQYIIGKKIGSGKELTVNESKDLANMSAESVLVNAGIEINRKNLENANALVDNNAYIQTLLDGGLVLISEGGFKDVSSNEGEYSAKSPETRKAAFKFLNKKFELSEALKELKAVKKGNFTPIQLEELKNRTEAAEVAFEKYARGGELYKKLQSELSGAAWTAYRKDVTDSRKLEGGDVKGKLIEAKTPEEFQAEYDKFGFAKANVKGKIAVTGPGGIRIINTKKALEVRNTDSAFHETIHSVALDALKGLDGKISKEGLDVIDGVLSALSPQEREILDKEVASRYTTTKPRKEWYEENLTILGELLKNKRINPEVAQKKSLGDKLAAWVPLMRDKYFENLKVDDSTGEGMLEMIKGLAENQKGAIAVANKFAKDTAARREIALAKEKERFINLTPKERKAELKAKPKPKKEGTFSGDKKQALKWKEKEGAMETKFTVNGKKFDIRTEPNAFIEFPNDVVKKLDVVFDKNKLNEDDFVHNYETSIHAEFGDIAEGKGITNKGDAFEVLSVATNGIIDHIKSHKIELEDGGTGKIESLIFTAKEPSRIKLYDALSVDMAGKLGWNVDFKDGVYVLWAPKNEGVGKFSAAKKLEGEIAKLEKQEENSEIEDYDAFDQQLENLKGKLERAKKVEAKIAKEPNDPTTAAKSDSKKATSGAAKRAGNVLSSITMENVHTPASQATIAKELPGMTKAQVMGRYNLSEQKAKDLIEDVGFRVKVDLVSNPYSVVYYAKGKKIPFKTLEEKAKAKGISVTNFIKENNIEVKGSGTLYGYLNDRIKFRIRDAIFNNPDYLSKNDFNQFEQIEKAANVIDESSSNKEKAKGPKYTKIKDSNVVSGGTMTDLKTKMLPIIKVLKKPLDAVSSLDAKVKPIIAELRKEFGKSFDINIKKVMGGKAGGKLNRFLLKNKKAILENMTTTWLMGSDNKAKGIVEGGMPEAIQKMVDGEWLNYPDWVGKTPDRESVKTDDAGRKSGHDLVRRIKNPAENIKDAEFLSFVVNEKGNPHRGAKESLAKAIGEELGFELFLKELGNKDSDISKAFVENQALRGALLKPKVFESVISDQIERGNVKFSEAKKKANDKLKVIPGIKVLRALPDQEALARINNDLSLKYKELSETFPEFLPVSLFFKATNFTGGNKITTLVKRGFDIITDVNKIKDPVLRKEAEGLINEKLILDLSQVVASAIKNEKKFSKKDLEALKEVSRIKNGIDHKRNLLSKTLHDKGVSLSIEAELAIALSSENAFAVLQGYLYHHNLNANSGRNQATAIHYEIGAITEVNGKPRRRELVTDEHVFPAIRHAIAKLTLYRNIVNAVKSGNEKDIERTRESLNHYKKWIKKNYTQFALKNESDVIKGNLTDAEGNVWVDSRGTSHPLITERLAKAIESGKKEDWDAVPESILRYFNEFVSLNPNNIVMEGKLVSKKYGVEVEKKWHQDSNVSAKQGELIYKQLIGKITKARATKDLAEYMKTAKTVEKATKVNNSKMHFKLKEGATNKEILKVVKTTDKALDNARKPNYSNTRKKIRVFDFDDTLARTKSKILFTMPDGSKGKIDAATFAKDAGRLEAEGAEWDFSEFSKVIDGKKGPLFDIAKIIADKNGAKDLFVLTARPQDAAGPIKEFLKELGLDIPIENITGLSDGQPSAKANWMIGKVAEGYNDFYFADDHMGNVKAVKEVFNTFDVKGNVQQARVKFSESMDKEFNNMISRNKGVASEKEFSAVVAKRRGSKKGNWKLWMPSSLDDFKGLTSYTFAGKGKQGDADQKFFQDAMITPYFRGVAAIETTRQTLKNDFKTLNKSFEPVLKKLGKLVPSGDYTYDQAIRVSLWDRAGMEVPGLSKRDKTKLVALINDSPELSAYADGLLLTSKQDAWTEPAAFWDAQTILSDLNNMTEKSGRRKYIQEFIDNSEIIFSEKNMNKIEAVYGTKQRDAIEDILYRMKNGTNRPAGMNKNANQWNNWVNNSIGSIMFFNRRSATLQLLSTANFVNWSDNNPAKAALAFANQPQYWKDFATIFNSDKLRQRRSGLKGDVNEAEIANAVTNSKDKASAALSYLLKLGFTPTQIADSFAISAGGAGFYRNRINTLVKKGMSKAEAEKQAWEDFSQISEETQQSGDPALISSDQASSTGRLVLSFMNTPIQLNRSIKKASQDIYNRRKHPGQTQMQSDISNVSKIMYYGAIQNMIFSTLQNSLFALIPGFDDDDEAEEVIAASKEEKMYRVMHGMIDTTLKGGFGYPGAVVSTVKNIVREYNKQEEKGYTADHAYTLLQVANLSPPIGSKLRKVYQAIQTKKFDKDIIKDRNFDVMLDGKFNLSPSYAALGAVTEGATSIPISRVVDELNSLTEALDARNTVWQRIALGMGWKTWDVSAENEEHDLIKVNAKIIRKIEGKIKARKTRARNAKAKKSDGKSDPFKRKKKTSNSSGFGGAKKNGF